MKIEFQESFIRDLDKIYDKTLLRKVWDIVHEIERASDFPSISNMKKIKGKGFFWSIRAGDYRLGLTMENSVIVLIRFLHRKEIYRFFP